MNDNKGFTLIEMVLYIGLFSIIIGGLLVTAYAMLDGNEQLEEQILVNEEGNFLVNKISHIIEDAKTFVQPFPNVNLPSSTVLSIIPTGSATPVTITINSMSITMDRGNGALPLNDTGAKITDLEFKYVEQSYIEDQLQTIGDTVIAHNITVTIPGISASFKINGRPFYMLRYKSR